MSSTKNNSEQQGKNEIDTEDAIATSNNPNYSSATSQSYDPISIMQNAELASFEQHQASVHQPNMASLKVPLGTYKEPQDLYQPIHKAQQSTTQEENINVLGDTENLELTSMSAISQEDEQDRTFKNPVENGSIKQPVIKLEVISKGKKSIPYLVEECVEELKEKLHSTDKLSTTKYFKKHAYDLLLYYISEISTHCEKNSDIPIEDYDYSKVYSDFSSYVNDLGGAINQHEILNYANFVAQKNLPPQKVQETAQQTQHKYSELMKNLAIKDFDSKEAEFVKKDPKTKIINLAIMLTEDSGKIKTNSIQRYLNGEDVDAIKNIEKVIVNNSIIPASQVKANLRSALQRARSEDTSMILRRLSQYSPVLNNQLDKLLPELSAEQTQVVTAVLDVMLGNSNEWEEQYNEHKFTSYSESIRNSNQKISKMSNEEIVKTYPSFFKALESKDDIENMCFAIRLNSHRFSELIERNYNVCKDIEAMASGKDWGYNIDAGLKLSILKVADLIGGNVDAYIKDIDLATDIANDLRDSKFGKWFGEFVKNNIVDIAGMMAIFATGPVGAAAVAITTTLGIASDVHRLKEHYEKLSKDKSNTDADILVGMMSEVALLVAPKAVGKYIPMLTKLIQKGVKNSNMAITQVSEVLGNVSGKSFDSALQENRKDLP